MSPLPQASASPGQAFGASEIWCVRYYPLERRNGAPAVGEGEGDDRISALKTDVPGAADSPGRSCAGPTVGVWSPGGAHRGRVSCGLAGAEPPPHPEARDRHRRMDVERLLSVYLVV